MEKQEKSFEEKFKELEIIVKELESGNASLDSSIEKYTKAMNLLKECNEELTKATDKVNKILGANGKLEDFDIVE